MAIRKLKVELTCSCCKKKAEMEDSMLTSWDGHILTSGVIETIKESKLPPGWISMEWIVRPEDSYSGFAGQKDGADFCSHDCLISYWNSKKNDV